MHFSCTPRCFPQVRVRGSVAHRGERERAHKIFRMFRQDNIDLRSCLLQVADKLDGLIGCYPPTDTNDNAPIE